MDRHDHRSSHAVSRLGARVISVAYRDRAVLADLSLDIPDGSFCVIIGANGCGKSTLLKALARVIAPNTGAVLLDGAAISSLHTREVARRLGLLPQESVAPDGITVRDLVARGRHPHQGFLGRWTPADERALSWALAATGIADLADRFVDELSGGQRQRVWIALVLAQETPLMLLDEPTSYLDIAHQVDLLELLRHLNRAHGRTLVAVLHDLNQAFRYADHLIAMKDGAILAEGRPERLVTPDFVKRLFGLSCLVIEDPVAHRPMVVPTGGRDASLNPQPR